MNDLQPIVIDGALYTPRSAPCDRCAGSGLEPDPKSNHPRPRPGGGFDCYECGGEGRLWSLDEPPAVSETGELL
jgi:DnaJ-class molecular chaperone